MLGTPPPPKHRRRTSIQRGQGSLGWLGSGITGKRKSVNAGLKPRKKTDGKGGGKKRFLTEFFSAREGGGRSWRT